jgi:NAD(P) transhydrogenase subunit alpha
MRIGIPAEIYPGETRVAATPETVKKLTAGGRHSVIVQSGAGHGAFIPDADNQTAGATLAASPA